MARGTARGVIVFGLIYAIGGFLRRVQRSDPHAVSLEQRAKQAVAQIQPWTETVLKALAIKEIVGVIDSTIRDIITNILQNGQQ